MAEQRTWDTRYRGELSAYETCAAKLETLVKDLLGEAGIDVVDVESRAKHPDSLQRKIDGKKDAYPEPLADVTDLIGVRVIAYYLEDVDQIREIIRKEFVVDLQNSTDKLDDLEPDRFGYRSVHYIVSLSAARAGLVEWGVFDGKRAEIQVRTATQHAWAAVEHKLSYKRTREAPRDLRRRLLRLGALFELADQEFSGVKQQLVEVEAQYSDDVKGGNLDLPVDKASLEAFVAENDISQKIIALAVDAGVTIEPPDSEEYEGRLDVDLRDLVSVLDRLGIETIAELDTLLREKAFSEAIEVFDGDSDLGMFQWRSPVDVLTILILYQCDAPGDLVASTYHPATVKAFEAVRSNLGSSAED